MAIQAIERRLPPIGITFIEFTTSAPGARRRRHSHGGFTPLDRRPAGTAAGFFNLDYEDEQDFSSSSCGGAEDAQLSTFASRSPCNLAQPEDATLSTLASRSPCSSAQSEVSTLSTNVVEAFEGCTTTLTNSVDELAQEPHAAFSEDRSSACQSQEHLDYYSEETPAADYSCDCEEPRDYTEDERLAYYSEGGQGGHAFSSEGEPTHCYHSEGSPVQADYRHSEAQSTRRSTATLDVLLSDENRVGENRGGRWRGRRQNGSKQHSGHQGQSHPIGAPPPQQPIGSGNRWSDFPPVVSPLGTGTLRRNSAAEVTINFGPEVSTVMIRNLPSHIRQQDLLEELDRCHFKGLYDFAYMPCSFKTGEGKGFAFINFVTTEAVTSFANSWHRTRRLGMTQREPHLNISPAEVQGLEENLAWWSAPRMRRIRNPHLRPYTTKEAPTGGRDRHRAAARTEEEVKEAPEASMPMPAMQLLAAAVMQGRTPPPSLQAALPRGLMPQRRWRVDSGNASMLGR